MSEAELSAPVILTSKLLLTEEPCKMKGKPILTESVCALPSCNKYSERTTLESSNAALFESASTLRSTSARFSSAFISMFKQKVATSPSVDQGLDRPDMDLRLDISPVDRDDSDEISFTGSTNDIDPIGGERVEHQGNDPFLGLAQSPVTSTSSVSTSSHSSLFLLRPDFAGLTEGNISEECLNMTQAVTQEERQAITLTQAERLSRLETNVAKIMQLKATLENNLAPAVRWLGCWLC